MRLLGAKVAETGKFLKLISKASINQDMIKN